MEDLIKELRPNRNEKYYELLITFIIIVNRDTDSKMRLTVGEIIELVNISRPTFYSFYENAEEFYVDLMELLAAIWPDYMTKKSQEMQEKDFFEMAFEAKFGVLMSNMKKISAKYPAIMKPWNNLYDHSILNVSQWYMFRFKMDKESAVQTSRLVLNELVLHDDLYYVDFEAYKALFFEQKTI
jgi:hypothetical protein